MNQELTPSERRAIARAQFTARLREIVAGEPESVGKVEASIDTAGDTPPVVKRTQSRRRPQPKKS